MSDNESASVSAVKLTEWKNEPSVEDLKQDFQEGKSYHDTHKQIISNWLDNLNVEGKAKVNSPKGNSRIVPKLIRKQAEWRYAALSEPFLGTDDIFKVSPVTWEDREAAQQNELVLNHQFNVRIDKVAFVDEYVRTLVDEGTAIVRVGWDFEEEEVEEDVPVLEFSVNPEMMELHQEIAEVRIENPAEFDQLPDEMKEAHELSMMEGIPYEATIVGYEARKVMKTVRNQPSLEVCDYRNVLIDPTCMGDINKASFAVYSFESSLSALKKSGRYKNLDAINLETASILAEPDHATQDDAVANFNFKDKPRKKFVVYEYWGYWDIEGKGKVTPIVAAWVGNTLIRMEENPFPDKKLPFVLVQYLPKRKSTYGEPDGALLEDNQKILGAVTRGMIDILGKSANGQTGVRKDMLDVTNRRKFESGQDYEFNANVDPRQGIHMHTYPEIPNSAQFMMQVQNIEAESITGVKAFSQGINSGSLGSVATGIRGAMDAASKREMGILRRLAKGVKDIGRKLMTMNAEFLSDEEIIRLTNDSFIKIRRDDLAGDFDLKLAISSAEEDNNKAQELAFMLQTMGNNMDAGISKMILSDIARLRKMPDLAKKIEMYEPQPDPIEERRRELEVALLEARVENERAHAQQRMSDAELAGYKANTETAKAGKLQSSADLDTLNFVEQEAGVKQERDLEKQGEQARAQARTKLMEYQLNRQNQ